ncbi:MAG: outer membrane protein assembly factor BamD [Candidatus Wallbacteria bacterium]|nr:outer membrane protein assembly factor BamD [Candidatus Wallbacteria bacterium]
MNKFFIWIFVSIFCVAASAGSLEVKDMVRGFRTTPGLYYQQIVDYAQSGHLTEVLMNLPVGDEFAPVLMEIKEWLYSECTGSGISFVEAVDAVNRRDCDNGVIRRIDNRNRAKSAPVVRAVPQNPTGPFGLQYMASDLYEEEEAMLNGLFSPVTVFERDLPPDPWLMKRDYYAVAGTGDEYTLFNQGLDQLYVQKSFQNACNTFTVYAANYPAGVCREQAALLAAFSSFHYDADTALVKVDGYLTQYPSGRFVKHGRFLKAIVLYKTARYAAAAALFGELKVWSSDTPALHAEEHRIRQVFSGHGRCRR